jgi:3-oxoacyl-[acyl-carrier protein] reductase
MGVLDDKVAIVTGSARGIGRATAELLSEHGANVVINDLDGDLARQTADELPGEAAVDAGDLTRDGVPTRSCRPPSTPGAASTSSSTTPATRSTRRSTR